jgi:hypothetical protein
MMQRSVMLWSCIQAATYETAAARHELTHVRTAVLVTAFLPVRAAA